MQPMNWNEVIAYFLNTVLVYLAVMGLTRIMPIIREKYGFLVPLATPIIALVISTVAKLLGDLLGYPIDFSAITAVITGTTAVWAHQLGYQFSAKKRGA